MKSLFVLLTLVLATSAFASPTTVKLEAICHEGVSTTPAEVRSLMQASLTDIFRVTKDSEARGLQKFTAMRYAVNDCESAVAAPVIAGLMEAVEPAFHICHRSTPRCISVLANILYSMDMGDL